jgi:hypothetical protein
MPLETPVSPNSKKIAWTGYAMSALPVIALVMSAVVKFMKPEPVVQGFVRLGYSVGAIAGLGALELACTVAYLIPQTSILGAILLTGYLGGATASTFRVGDAWIGPVVLGILVWGGLFLREPKLRALIPIRAR